MVKVLLVEDDNNLREIFEMRLQADGFQTLTASNGEEALVVAMRERPDLIVADVMMPKLSGFEMLETLRAAPGMEKVKVVMMTALGQAEDQARGEKLGVIKYLVKSQVTLEDFARVVSEVLKPGTADSSSNNNKESEKSMPEDTTPTNAGAPMPPAGDSSAGANPISGSATPSDGTGVGQPSTADEQSSVQNQINDFVSGSPAPAAGASIPADPTPAVPAEGSGSMPVVSQPPPAEGGETPTETPTDPLAPPTASSGV
ncbi:hypothetical protein COU91_00430 [Candidatus Saccharibacteria bacterium CG10_big_fil_rev_8_21_14_0_10_47_8]|nr:MAG: hypothetical protein COU91_00430 [Candidatus Saccharibacteria bacterium CG10_big_fil_rev_8_21_14_0_10_47_8]